MSIVHQIWRTQAKLNLIYANCAPDMENTSQIKLDICQLCTRCGEHKPNYIWYMSIFTRYSEHNPNYTWYMSIVHQIWRKQSKLNFIYVNFTLDMENTSQIIPSICQFAPDVEKTSQIIPDICQLCTRFGENIAFFYHH